jgi:hypothetical protein
MLKDAARARRYGPRAKRFLKLGSASRRCESALLSPGAKKLPRTPYESYRRTFVSH